MKPIIDFLSQEIERDDEFYFKLYYILMEELRNYDSVPKQLVR